MQEILQKCENLFDMLETQINTWKIHTAKININTVCVN